MLGREISVSLHNAFLFPDKPLAHFNYTTLRWIAYAIPMYVLPIALVFISRTLTFRHHREQSDRYYGFYMAMMIMGFIVSTTVSALILELTYYKDNFDFLESFVRHMRWGILPAFVCGFVAYRMDTPVSESETLSDLIIAAALRFLGWGTVAIVIMLYATDDLAIEESNLRFTLVGTAFFVVGLLGASARFKAARLEE
jgi:MFS family permease